jgi:hypothetical protein
MSFLHYSHSSGVERQLAYVLFDAEVELVGGVLIVQVLSLEQLAWSHLTAACDAITVIDGQRALLSDIWKIDRNCEYPAA